MSNMSQFAETILKQKYSHLKADGTKEEWADVAERVTKHVFGAVPNVDESLVWRVRSAIRDRKFLPGGRYLYASGLPLHQINNCLLLKAEDSREGWAQLLRNSTMALMTGAGIGIDYSAIRPNGSPIGKTAGTSSGPLALMQAVNEAGRFIRQGGNRRSAIWAGLNWSHADCLDYIKLKDWTTAVKRGKAEDYNFPGPLDGTNISILLDDDFFLAIADEKHDDHAWAQLVYTTAVEHMLRTGEPGFSIDIGNNKGETLRNACTELTSRDDSDVCNLGSINLANVVDLDEMRQLVSDATAFLLAGTVYSDVPYGKVAKVRNKNRRLGLGLMGIHEWLIKRNKPYAPDGELQEYLAIYASESTASATRYAQAWNLSVPVKCRAIAPTGTIGIIAETTTGIEPIFSVAYKRSYIDKDVLKWQYVIDPTAKRLIDGGVAPAAIEDAMHLASDPERRLEFQAFVQQYVDHAISSTINLPPWNTDGIAAKQFSNLLLRYLPSIRGITVYPDGARSGQPLEVCSYEEAASKLGIVYESVDVCDISKGESCGS